MKDFFIEIVKSLKKIITFSFSEMLLIIKKFNIKN
tara:strand:+ start:2033 stop:2137 length:105 start_codon:yes stop_codon:yes gene_type:complete